MNTQDLSSTKNTFRILKAHKPISTPHILTSDITVIKLQHLDMSSSWLPLTRMTFYLQMKAKFIHDDTGMSGQLWFLKYTPISCFKPTSLLSRTVQHLLWNFAVSAHYLTLEVVIGKVNVTYWYMNTKKKTTFIQFKVMANIAVFWITSHIRWFFNLKMVVMVT